MSNFFWIVMALYAIASLGIPLFIWAYKAPRDRATRLRWTACAALVFISLCLGTGLLLLLDLATVPHWPIAALGLTTIYSYLLCLFAFLWAVCPPPTSLRELKYKYLTLAVIAVVSLFSILKVYWDQGFPRWALLALVAAHAIVALRLWRSNNAKAAAFTDRVLQAS